MKERLQKEHERERKSHKEKKEKERQREISEKDGIEWIMDNAC